MSALRNMAMTAAELPGLQRLGRPLYRRYFRRPYYDGNAYCGVYDSYSQALAAAPETLPHTYDLQVAGRMYRSQLYQVRSCDYPVMHWLSLALGEGQRDIFDLGGHIGQAYYGFARYLQYPSDLRWRVHDVPAVMATGRLWARKHDPHARLSFAESPKDADGCDVLVTTGALQYLDYSLPELLQRLVRRPVHVLVNLVPMHPAHGYFTLQNLGIAICPYRVMCLRDFVEQMTALGYQATDHWELPERQLQVPFEPATRIECYHGFYFRRSLLRPK